MGVRSRCGWRDWARATGAIIALALAVSACTPAPAAPPKTEAKPAERESDDPSYFQNFSVNGYAIGIDVLLYAMTH